VPRASAVGGTRHLLLAHQQGHLQHGQGRVVRIEALLAGEVSNACAAAKKIRRSLAPIFDFRVTRDLGDRLQSCKAFSTYGGRVLCDHANAKS